jgi:hypothetical protein
VAKVHERDARFIEQRPEQRLLLAKLEPARLRDRPVVMVRLRDDRDFAQTVGIASTFVRAARVGVDEDRPWLWQCRPASERAVREEEAHVLPDREGP